jgi:TRAP-type C4-dicarboxylate transport system substrate-binding protein
MKTVINTQRLRALQLGACALIAGAALSLAPLHESAAEPVKFKIATIAPDGTPWSKLLTGFKRDVSKASDKALSARVYLNSIKGDELSIVRQVYKGTLQMGGVSTAALATIAKDMDILELPYAFSDFKTADATLDKVRPLVQQMLEEKGMMLLMYSENGYRSMATQDKCVKSPSDLKAVKMRSQESDVHLETYRALGASPVPIPVSEVLTSLQTGIVKGFDNTAIITQALGWNQGVKYYTTTQHIYQPALIIMNKAWFDGLSPEHQKIIREKGMKLEQKGRKMVRQLTPILMKNFETMGITVCELSDTERAAFKEATKGVWELRAKKASPLGKKLIEQLR